MFGEHVDTLNVFIKTKPNLDSPVWTKKGNKGNKWLKAQIDIKAKVLYNVSLLVCVCIFMQTLNNSNSDQMS